MSYPISTLKTELTAVLHGTTLNKVQALDNLIDRAARQLIADCDPQETKRISQIDNAIYDRVYDYAVPVDLKGNCIVDIRPQVNRKFSDKFSQFYNEAFDYTKYQVIGKGQFTISWDTGVRTLRISKDLPAGQLINGATTITDNGTWAVGSLASNLRNDNLNYVYGSSSLRFDVDAGADPSTAYLENSTMNAVDLTRDEDQGVIFAYVWIPTPANVTNFILRWGSSSADYWSRTVTVAQNNVAFQTGWNLLRFDWDGATVTGSPDASVVDYLRFTVTYDGTADTDFRLNNIVSQLGTIYEMEYYSKYLFRSASTGAFQETVTSDNDLVNLDTDSYNMLFNLVCYYVAQQTQSANSGFDSTFWLTEYNNALKRYKARYKSEIIKPQGTYYSMPRKPSPYPYNRT